MEIDVDSYFNDEYLPKKRVVQEIPEPEDSIQEYDVLTDFNIDDIEDIERQYENLGDDLLDDIFSGVTSPVNLEVSNDDSEQVTDSVILEELCDEPEEVPSPVILEALNDETDEDTLINTINLLEFNDLVDCNEESELTQNYLDQDQQNCQEENIYIQDTQQEPENYVNVEQDITQNNYIEVQQDNYIKINEDNYIEVEQASYIKIQPENYIVQEENTYIEAYSEVPQETSEDLNEALEYLEHVDRANILAVIKSKPAEEKTSDDLIDLENVEEPFINFPINDLNSYLLELNESAESSVQICDLNGKENVIPSHLHQKIIFKCFYCDKTYLKHTQLVEHLQVHFKGSSEKNTNIYMVKKKKPRPKDVPMCYICQKCFTKESSLQRHVKKHNNVIPYSCDICHMGFAKENFLRNHRRHHFKHPIKTKEES